MADPTGLLVATAAANAVEDVGLPEAQLDLGHAVVHLATAPRSNRTALGIWKAIEDVRSRHAPDRRDRCRPTCAAPTTKSTSASAMPSATATPTTAPGAGSSRTNYPGPSPTQVVRAFRTRP